MTENGHRERIDKIEAETIEIKRQIMKLEFQQKKDIAAAKRESAAAHKEFEETDRRIQRTINHICKLIGITFEELDLLDVKLQETGFLLTRPRKRSTIS